MNETKADVKGFRINLGATVRDRITTLRGVVIGRHEWLYGCRRYTVQPVELKDGKPVDPTNFDEDSLEVTDAAVPHEVKRTGGPPRDPGPSGRSARR